MLVSTIRSVDSRPPLLAFRMLPAVKFALSRDELRYTDVEEPAALRAAAERATGGVLVLYPRADEAAVSQISAAADCTRLLDLPRRGVKLIIVRRAPREP